MSPTLQTKYCVEITNMPTVLSSIAVRATDDAKKAYEDQKYFHMTLFISEDDIKQGLEGLRKEVQYNFPHEFLRKNEIELNQPPALAEFQLKLRPAAEGQ